MPTSSDAAAIVALADTYTDAVNNRDWTRYRACWTEDAVWDLGAPVGLRREGLEAITAQVRRTVGAMDLFVLMNHAVTTLEVNGDTARANATLNEIGHVKPKSPDLLHGGEGLFILAIYTDELRRGPDGAWRYVRRTCQVPYALPLRRKSGTAPPQLHQATPPPCGAEHRRANGNSLRRVMRFQGHPDGLVRDLMLRFA